MSLNFVLELKMTLKVLLYWCNLIQLLKGVAIVSKISIDLPPF